MTQVTGTVTATHLTYGIINGDFEDGEYTEGYRGWTLDDDSSEGTGGVFGEGESQFGTYSPHTGSYTLILYPNNEVT